MTQLYVNWRFPISLVRRRRYSRSNSNSATENDRDRDSCSPCARNFFAMPPLSSMKACRRTLAPGYCLPVIPALCAIPLPFTQ
jgi:hypothetical protein